MTIQCRCYTWHGVIECHDIESMTSLRWQTLALTNIDNLSPTIVDGSGGTMSACSNVHFGEKDFFQKYWVESPQNRPQKTHFSLWGPFWGPQINVSYLGFLSSVLGYPKLIGPGYGLCGPLYSILTYCDDSVPVWHLSFHTMMPWILTYGAVTAPKSQTVYSDFPRFLIII